MKVGRLFGSAYWKLNKYTSNIPIIFQNVGIRLKALDEIIDFRTEFSDFANISVLLFGCVGK